MQTYSLLLGVGALSGLLLAFWRAPEKELSGYMNASVWVLFGTLIGSRTATVMVNFPYYQTHPGEIFQVWMGGLSGLGALVGGALSIIIVAKWKNIDTGALADALFPLAGTLMVTAWLGCWLDSCGYGYPSNAWWALPAKDEWGVMVNRVPVQFVGALLTLVMIWLLEGISKHFTTGGTSALIGLFMLSAEIIVLSFLRADPTPILNGLRLEAWGGLGLMILCALGVANLLLRRKFNK
jgi:prolipoprotein diacylglyceryltransferase